MNSFSSALWAETSKLRRSKVPLFTVIGFSVPPLIGGLFMIILKDPTQAQSMGLISAKAQLTIGVAEWATLLGLLAQATAVGGMTVPGTKCAPWASSTTSGTPAARHSPAIDAVSLTAPA